MTLDSLARGFYHEAHPLSRLRRLSGRAGLTPSLERRGMGSRPDRRTHGPPAPSAPASCERGPRHKQAGDEKKGAKIFDKLRLRPRSKIISSGPSGPCKCKTKLKALPSPPPTPSAILLLPFGDEEGARKRHLYVI